jgi:hypothetical protein
MSGLSRGLHIRDAKPPGGQTIHFIDLWGPVARIASNDATASPLEIPGHTTERAIRTRHQYFPITTS